MDFNLVFFESLNVNVVISFYMNGLLSNFRVKDGKPILSMGAEYRPTGTYFSQNSGWVSSHSALTYYKKFEHENYYIFRPVISHYTGYIDAHELVVVDNIPIVNATLFNKLVTIHSDINLDFQVLYNPPYCSDSIEPKDTNHVNGIGLREGKLRYLTSFTGCKTDENRGWKGLDNTGIVFDMTENKTILDGLCMPHSPRFYKDSIFVCNSGKGELIKHTNGQTKKAKLGSFLRGIDFHEGYIFVGVSKIRETSKNIDWQEINNNKCCLYILDVDTLEIISSIDFNEIQKNIQLREIIDITILPNNTVVGTSMSDGYKSLHFV